MTRVFFYIDKD